MKPSGFLAIAFFCLSASAFSTAPTPVQDCDKIDVRMEVFNTSNGQDNGYIKVELVKGSQRNIKYIFCKKDGKVLNENQFGTNSLNGLTKGEYICIVGNDDCTKKVDFTIK
jgi:hypothetical protein